MPRPANTTDAQLKDILARIERLVDAAKKEGREDALAGLRDLVGGDAATKPARRTAKKRKPAAKTTKSGKKRKNSWAGLTPSQHLKRVNAIRKGRGLPLKSRL